MYAGGRGDQRAGEDGVGGGCQEAEADGESAPRDRQPGRGQHPRQRGQGERRGGGREVTDTAAARSRWRTSPP